jgi:hypothetical protein
MNTIEERNKKFATFLGYKYFPSDTTKDNPGWRKDVKTHVKLGYGIGHDYLCRKHRELNFHDDWNWIIEVIRQIKLYAQSKHIINFTIYYINVSLCHLDIEDACKNCEYAIDAINNIEIIKNNLTK